MENDVSLNGTGIYNGKINSIENTDQPQSDRCLNQMHNASNPNELIVVEEIFQLDESDSMTEADTSNDIDANDFQTSNSSNQIEPYQENSIQRFFPCPNCEYVAKRKYTLKKHQKEHCPAVKKSNAYSLAKDQKCSMCHKMFSHDGLRSHLRGFINSSKTNRQPRGEHKKYNVEQHMYYLNIIKLK